MTPTAADVRIWELTRERRDPAWLLDVVGRSRAQPRVIEYGLVEREEGS